MRICVHLACLVVVLSLTSVSGAQTHHVVQVSAATDWTDTGIDLVSGEHLLILAKGIMNSAVVNPPRFHEWNGPDGRGDMTAADQFYPLPGYARFSLIGRIGAGGDPFGIGESYEFDVPASGRLHLGINDNYFPDNDGLFVACVVINSYPPGNSAIDGPVRETSHVSSHRNSPNPTGASILIEFDLSAAERALLTVFDVSGRRVRELVNKSMVSGKHAIRWDCRDESGNDVAAGTYLYRLSAGDVKETGRVVVVR